MEYNRHHVNNNWNSNDSERDGCGMAGTAFTTKRKHNKRLLSNGMAKGRNFGFTLVEMIVVLAIMAIMMSAAVWGVTGWIAHYEYISSEEKARTIYMGAQSALSAADSRGTLDEYMDKLETAMRNKGTIFANTDSTVGLSKEVFGIPAKKDNEGVEHEYGYLMVKLGDYASSADRDSNPLFSLLNTYVSDSEQLNGSIVVEFDLTAKKVYSAFYSSWATSITYDTTDSVVRGAFHITEARRKIDYREDYAVGYYSSDQVNVIQIETGDELKVLNCELHNEETLYLTMNSTSLIGDADTSFDVELYETTKLYNSFGESLNQFANNLFGAGNAGNSDNEILLCSFTVSRDMLGGENNTPEKIDIDVKDDEGNVFGRFPFIVSYDTGTGDDGEEMNVLNVTLDALSTRQSMALATNGLDEEGRTVNTSYSITRLLGVAPKNIFARVSVEPKEANTIYVTGSSVDSNAENDLFETKNKSSEYISDDTAFELTKCRHLSNIRYTEQYTVINGVEHTYALTEDIDWSNGIIYNSITGAVEDEDTSGRGYTSLDTASTGFPMIPKINERSMFDGKGNQITGLVINNESGVEYERNSDGSLASDASPVNNAKVLGLFGVNLGTIRRTIISDSKVTALSAEEAKSSDTSIYSDSLEAVGLLCGRNDGYLRELYFDKDCAVDASVAVNYDDVAEAKALGEEAPESDINLNQKYGCGVGMAAGTALLEENAVYDRIRTSGKVVGRITGAAETPSVSETDARKDIYDDSNKDTDGKTNAQKYAYGVGGVFGYVFGEYNGTADRLGIGISAAEVEANIAGTSGGDNAYVAMYRREVTEDTEKDAYGNDVTVTKFSKTEEDLFKDWGSMSVVNKADVEGDSFTGGIIGNIYITGLKSRKSELVDEDGDLQIPENAVAQLINCHNYGDTSGTDFVGGVVGVNGEGGYITECVSYGSPSAENGVSAGITSENFGYIEKCSVERAAADDDNYNENTNRNENYVPQISGNMLVAGAITSVNHDNCVVYDCTCAILKVEGVSSKIEISGDGMNTFGYLVGTNDGVINKGKAGNYIGYKSDKTSIVIGGAVGVNNNIVKNVSVTFDLEDKGQANCIGGVVGENLGKIKNCIYGGKISKTGRSSAGMTVGGITAKNGSSAGNINAEVIDCYLIGAGIDFRGICNFVESASESVKIAQSSAVGGVCAINYNGASIKNCHITSLNNEDGSIYKQSKLEAVNGMAGGVAAVNLGTIRECGYTDKIFVEADGEFEVTEDTKDTADMGLLNTASAILNRITIGDENAVREDVHRLNDLFMDSDSGELQDAVQEICGDIPAPGFNEGDEMPVYALPKASYDISANEFVISLNKGKGYIGGVAGYNGATGVVEKCASGKWVVENYLPTVNYGATGGIIGVNSADNNQVNTVVNFAYVRTELPEIPLDQINDSNGQVLAAYTGSDNRFHYVGGIIGTQYNADKTGWVVDRCVNAGTVLNYYGNNVGGVICQLMGTGGTVQYCYNYGMLMTGFTTAANSGYSGTGGGIISHYTELRADQINNVLHCQNHGTVAFPMQGVDYDTNLLYHKLGKMCANDVGGIVGEISAPLSTSLYTVNIKDCVNGINARVYSESQSAGVLGMVGCYTKGGTAVRETVNSIFANVESCRNYSSNIWRTEGTTILSDVDDSTHTTNKEKAELRKDTGGLLSGRENFAAAYPKSGYTTIQNCFSILLLSYQERGNFWNRGGKIEYHKQGSTAVTAEKYKYSNNNFYMDEMSFQYTTRAGRIYADEFKKTTTGSTLTGTGCNISAVISEGKPADSELTVLGTGNNLNRVDEFSRLYLGAIRLMTVAYGENGDKYALIGEPKGYNITSLGYVLPKLNATNAWIEDDTVYINATDADKQPVLIECPVIYRFTEKGSTGPYSNKLVDHFYLDRVKKLASYKEAAEEEAGVSLDSKLEESRIPTADEYDIDYEELDKAFMQYIADYKKDKKPDKVMNVNATKNPYSGNYSVSWEVESTDGGEVTATDFDMEVRYFELPAGETFSIEKIAEYTEKNYLIKTEHKNPNGTTSTFDTPSDIEFSTGMQYYAVVRVMDSRGSEEPEKYYSDLMDMVLRDEETGEVTGTVKSYVALEPKLPEPEFEIVAYGENWMLHLKNAEDFKDVVQSEGFEAGAYYLNNSNKIEAGKTVTMTKDDIAVSAGGNKEDGLLNNAVVANKFATGNMNLQLYGYVKADGYLDSDLQKLIVYVPKYAHPTDIDYSMEAEENGDHLNDGDYKPTYSGELTYNRFNQEKKTINGVSQYVDVVPPVAQIFKVELYGYVLEKDEDGNETIWHETIAEKEYTLAAGSSEEVKIGYYDAPSNVNLKKYTGFGVDCWYAASGQGEVYNYFETTKEYADHTSRYSGFITDLSNSALKPKYYFHPVKLKNPQVEIVCMGREPRWYARLKNPMDYYGSGAIVRLGTNNSYTIDTSNNAKIDGVLQYAVQIPTGNNARFFMAVKEGCYDSDRVYYSPTNSNVDLYGNLNSYSVNYALTTETYTDEEGNETEGSFTLDKDNNLSFRGTLKYNSNSTVGQYYRYELYAKDEDEQQVTLFLSDDIPMKYGSAGNNKYQTTEPIAIDISGDDENIDISKYHDFHVAVWYAMANINTTEKTAENHFSQYFKISEEVAKSVAYDEEKGAFVDARSKGILIDISKDVDNPEYYYVTPLADSRYADTTTNSYKYNVLYREAEETVSSLKKNEDGSDVIYADGAKVSWSMNPNFYNTDVVCDVEVKMYQLGKDDAEPSVQSLLSQEPYYTINVQAVDKYAVRQEDDYTFDWDTYKYYALVRVKDAGIESESMYSAYALAALSPGLPKPLVSVLLFGDSGNFVHLENYEEYDDKENVTVYVELVGRNGKSTTPYEIKLDNTDWPVKNNIPLPYSVSRDAHNIADGSVTSIRAWAEKIDPETNEVILESVNEFKKKIYMPYWAEPVPSGMNVIGIENTEISVSEDHKKVTFGADISYDCSETKYRPKVDQGFTIALVGTPKNKVNNYQRPTILTRTESDYLKLTAGEKKTVENVELVLDDSVNLDDYKDIYVYVWYSHDGVDGLTKFEYPLTREQLYANTGRGGMTIDYTDGVDNAGYYYERAFNDNKKGQTEVRGTNKVQVSLEE